MTQCPPPATCKVDGFVTTCTSICLPPHRCEGVFTGSIDRPCVGHDPMTKLRCAYYFTTMSSELALCILGSPVSSIGCTVSNDMDSDTRSYMVQFLNTVRAGNSGQALKDLMNGVFGASLTKITSRTSPPPTKSCLGCTGVCGDTNHDGSVDVSDVIKIVNYSLYGPPASCCDRANADVNNDGSIDVADVTSLVAFINDELPLRCHPR